jgi:hypothetical protein
MEGKVLWEKFAKEGKVADYLEYKRHVDNAEAEEKMELTGIDRNQCFGVSDKGTECR